MAEKKTYPIKAEIQEYMAYHDISATAMAGLLGITPRQTFISWLKSGYRNVTLDILEEFGKLTAGEEPHYNQLQKEEIRFEETGEEDQWA